MVSIEYFNSLLLTMEQIFSIIFKSERFAGNTIAADEWLPKSPDAIPQYELT